MTMRRAVFILATALGLAGCDAEVWQAIGTTVADLPAHPSAASPVPSLAPTYESLQALDLSGQTWVPEQPGTWAVEGDRLGVGDRKGTAHLFYRPALGDSFTLSFSEPRTAVKGELKVWWMLDREDSPRQDADGHDVPNAEHFLALGASGSCKLTHGGVTRAERKVAGPRTWAIAVTPGHTTVTLNGEVFASYDHVPGYHPSPFLAFSSTGGAVAAEHVTVTSAAPGARTTMLRQWSLEGRGTGIDRFNLLYASDWDTLPTPAEMDTLPVMLPHVVAMGGYPLGRTEGLVFARTDGFGGGTHGGAGVFVNPRYCKGAQLSAHELAHGYNAAGSQKARSGEGWLVEGFADYISYMAFARYQGQPVWKSPAVGKLPDYDPPLSESHAVTRERDGDAAIQYKIYTKGRVFFEVLSAYTSPEDVRAVVVGSREVDKLTGEQFVQALEARTGKNLAFLRPGWLVAGAYQGVSPTDARDGDKDGLLDFQEIAWGTDPRAKDTDGDGTSDYAERAAGTDPLKADVNTTHGLVSGGMPDAQSEEATIPPEGTPSEDD